MFQQTFDVSQVATQVLQLLFDSSTPYFARRTSLFHNGEKRLACFLTIGSRFLLPIRLWVELVYDLFTELPGFIQQAQVCRIADRLWGYCRIQYQLAPMFRFLFLGRAA